MVGAEFVGTNMGYVVPMNKKGPCILLEWEQYLAGFSDLDVFFFLSLWLLDCVHSPTCSHTYFGRFVFLFF